MKFEKYISETVSSFSDFESDKDLLRAAIIAEYDAINLYEQMSGKTKSKEIRKALLDIAREEKVHIGEFEALLEKLDSEHLSSKKEGKKEVEEM
jgi:rubrerythrin